MGQVSEKIAIFWFRRDLRLSDNTGLYHALSGDHPVLPLFIFDSEILDDLPDQQDRRVAFIHRALEEIREELEEAGSSLLIRHGRPQDVWEELLEEFAVGAVYTNHDYEPYARDRDDKIRRLLDGAGIPFHTYKDQVIFEKDEVLTQQEQPYSVYTPYRNSWRDKLGSEHLEPRPSEKRLDNCVETEPLPFPTLKKLGFKETGADFPSRNVRDQLIEEYHEKRDYPAIRGTSRLSVHLRFGTVSIRKLVKRALDLNETWLDELIWREFYMMILWHHPRVVDQPFREKYQAVEWRNDRKEFEAWCQGKTGYPIVDAGMRELNKTGFMHNRVRMITASFLTKHLLVDWRWGERYFAEKLLDYELSSNNGNWQWAAGCGCDAAPYFRIFNPTTQIKKYDPDHDYIKKWVPEYDSDDYPDPLVEHKSARQRALDTYKAAVS